MIDSHKRFSDSFNTLPNIQANPEADPPKEGFKPVYHWGDQLHLNQLLKVYRDKNQKPYPLIYNVSNYTEQDISRNIVKCDVSLVIAQLNEKTDDLNKTRWSTSYKNVLFPTAKNMETLFKKSQVFVWDGVYRLYEFPNYGNDKENETTDIWDALRFDTTITITNNCLNKIYF